MYELQVVRTHDPFHPMGFDDWHGAPNKHQYRLMQHIREALLQGLFYNIDVYNYVREQMADVLTPEITQDLDTGTMRTELGRFGTDIYRCRQVVEDNMIRMAHKEAVEKLVKSGLIHVGKKLRNLQYGSSKLSTATIEHINFETGYVSLVGKRRGSKFPLEFALGANSTCLLIALTQQVRDRSISYQSNGETKTITINPNGNRLAELTCQLS